MSLVKEHSVDKPKFESQIRELYIFIMADGV